MGYSNIYVMSGGLNGLFESLENNEKSTCLKMEAEFAHRFRERARKAFKEGTFDTKKESPKPEPDFSFTAAARGGC